MKTKDLLLQMTVANIDKTVLDQIVTATIWYGEAGWEAKLEPSIETAAAETAVATETAAAEIAVESIQSQTDTMYQQQLLVSCVEADATTTQVGVSVVLTHIDSPTEFYVQWSEELDAINNLQALLQVQLIMFFKNKWFEMVVVLGASS